MPLVAINTVRFAHALRLVHAELCPLDYQLDPHEPTLNALLALYGSDRVLASAHPRRDPGSVRLGIN